MSFDSPHPFERSYQCHDDGHEFSLGPTLSPEVVAQITLTSLSKSLSLAPKARVSHVGHDRLFDGDLLWCSFINRSTWKPVDRAFRFNRFSRGGQG